MEVVCRQHDTITGLITTRTIVCVIRLSHSTALSSSAKLGGDAEVYWDTEVAMDEMRAPYRLLITEHCEHAVVNQAFLKLA